ncbi:hypothetical protein HMPREF0591_4813 [Mycobacterium parascrofulaceum ATCC BAA-614]|uniref:Head-to-tail adaptor n=1 Tax=Mycobacterium parascrofulaceum ATCC BAA-614 TaxID=525368 RepID=D5PF69_9MYCO|nr:hypothetical protein [Mycobacterium parascrofulaceum]EFG75250.1 hypothetical protein HMPREF0591_4813 [Mycobacterium parascrofulaceum ATCC BAA-614]
MPDPTPEDAARSAARRFCGWHVTPVREDDEVTLDGPGSVLLVLPTLRLIKLTSVVENGVELDVDTDLFVSARGLVRKRCGAWWSRNYGSIVVTMTHGFPADVDADDNEPNAADFNAAVASIAGRSPLATTTKGRVKAVGPFQYYDEAMATGSAFTVVERALLEQYRLESAP